MKFRRLVVAAAIFGPAALTLPAHAGPGYLVDGRCGYIGVLDPFNTVNYVYTGTATATGPAGQVTVATTLTCELTTIPNGGTSFSQTTVTAPGPAVAVVGDALGFDSRRPQVCTTVSATFGPVTLVTVTRPRTCA